MDINGGSRFVPGPLPKHSLAPNGADALYSGVLECPITDRVEIKVEGGSASPRGGALEIVRVQCEPSEASCGQFLVPILEHMGGDPMVQALLGLQQEAMSAVSSALQLVASGKPLTDDEAVDVHRMLEHYESEYTLPTDMLLRVR